MARLIFTDEFLAHADRLKSEFPSLKSIAAHLDVNPDELSKNLRAKGYSVKVRDAKPSLKRIDLDLDAIIDLNCKGYSRLAMAKHFGVSPKVIERIMLGEGIAPRERFENFTAADVARMFNEGYSVLAISKHFGTSRTPIISRLKEQGIDIRTSSEASLLRFSSTSPEQRQKVTAKARSTRMGNLRNGGSDTRASIGLGEVEFRAALRAGDVAFSEQEAVGPYCLDFRVRNIAVEIKYTVSASGYAGDRAKRIEYIVDSGMGLIYVSHSGLEFLVPCLPHVIPLIDRLSRDPAMAGQKRMIRCRAYSGLARFKGDQVSPVVITPDYMATIHKMD